MSTIHVIDFEGNKRIGILEFGIVTLKNFELYSAETHICKNDFHKYLEKFLILRRTGLLAAHSSQIEDSLVRYYWASPGKVPLFANEKETLSWGPWIDTKIIYRKLFKKLKSYELRKLISVFGLEKKLLDIAKKYCPTSAASFHNSLFDALATALLIQNLQNHFSNVSASMLAYIT